MVLTLNDVSKSFVTKDGMLNVLEKISFNVYEGEVIALVGPSGSGKTTILNLIAGLLKASSGEVKVNGEIGYMFQRDNLFEWRSIYKNVLLGLEIQNKLSEENINKVINMLKDYGLWDFRNNNPSELSGGMRQRVALIRTLATNPDLMLLDEPFASLDYQTKLLVSNDIYKIIKRENKTTIIVTHDISEAISMSNRIIILSKRPASINKIHEINFDLDEERTPLNVRKSELFRDYFDVLWGELNEDNIPL